jgi:non-ribosomal peptide synthetase component E (peptide arylation enzyme)
VLVSRYHDSRFANSAFLRAGHFPLHGFSSHQREHEQEYERTSAGALHVINDILSEFAALDLRRALHETGEVVGHAFAGDGAV